MLVEYEEKRLEYNLALNDLNKFKKDFETNRIEITKRKFNSDCKAKEENIEKLKQELESYFDKNKSNISKQMLKQYLNISLDYDFYSDVINKDENGEHYISKQSKEEVTNYIESLKNKTQKYLDNKAITNIIYNDLNRCIDIYSEDLFKEWKKLDDKKSVTVDEEKEIKKVSKEKKSKKAIANNENLLYTRLMLPLLVIDIIFVVYLFLSGFECKVVDSEVMSAALCAFNIMGRLYIIFITPIVLIYFIGRGIKKVTKK